MFGLMGEKTACKAIADQAMRARLAGEERDRAKERIWELLGELKTAEAVSTLNKDRADAAEAEVKRLTEILTAHPVAPVEEPAKDKEPVETNFGTPRVLSGLEVVSRATQHRSLHNQKGR